MRHRRTGSVWGVLAVCALAFSMTSCAARVDAPALPSSQRPSPRMPAAPEIDSPPRPPEGVDINWYRLDRISRTV